MSHLSTSSGRLHFSIVSPDAKERYYLPKRTGVSDCQSGWRTSHAYKSFVNMTM